MKIGICKSLVHLKRYTHTVYIYMGAWLSSSNSRVKDLLRAAIKQVVCSRYAEIYLNRSHQFTARLGSLWLLLLEQKSCTWVVWCFLCNYLWINTIFSPSEVYISTLFFPKLIMTKRINRAECGTLTTTNMKGTTYKDTVVLTHDHLSLSFMDDDSESEEYEDSDSESEDPFTSHQARRQTASGSQRGAMAPFYNYPGAGWTPPFSSAPPLPWVTQTHRHKDRQTDRTCQMLQEEDVALRYSFLYTACVCVKICIYGQLL